ncbi:MAG: hypothetical protein ACTTKH_00355 [Treponema sp.]
MLANDTEITLYAKDTRVVLKGNITGLYCRNNQLTALDVQGLTNLQKLECYGNQLTADAFKKLFNDLPQRETSDEAMATLYTEETYISESNCKDFAQSEPLEAAFDGAKGRNWKMYKLNANDDRVEI